MLSELFQAICTKAEEASHDDVKVTRIPGDHRRQHVTHGDNPLAMIDIPPPLRCHQVLGLSDFIDAAQRWGMENTGEEESLPQGVVWHSNTRLVLVVDDEDRRDVVFMKLPMAETFWRLDELQDQTFNHRDFVQLLRHDLRGVVPDGLLVKLRKIEASHGGRNASEIQTGREKGVQEFAAELVGAVDLDEVVIATTPVYSAIGMDSPHGIKMTLDVDPKHLQFRLLPLPDEIDFAMQNEQLLLHEALVKDLPGMTVLYGDPRLPGMDPA